MGSTSQPLLHLIQSHGSADISVCVEAGPSYSPYPQIVQFLMQAYCGCCLESVLRCSTPSTIVPLPPLEDIRATAYRRHNRIIC
jgi:hypothetical protein